MAGAGEERAVSAPAGPPPTTATSTRCELISARGERPAMSRESEQVASATGRRPAAERARASPSVQARRTESGPSCRVNGLRVMAWSTATHPASSAGPREVVHHDADARDAADLARNAIASSR